MEDEKVLILSPAYNRTYESSGQAVTDWIQGRDFRVSGGGPYCSSRDSNNLRLDYNKVYIAWNWYDLVRVI